MFNVRLAGGHLYGKQLFTWLSLVVSLVASFVLSFFPLDVLDEIWDLIESVSKGFLTYSFMVLLPPSASVDYLYYSAVAAISTFLRNISAIYLILNVVCIPELNYHDLKL